MCGIAGIISSELSGTVANDRVAQMQKALVQRGPDDQGLIHFSNNKTIVSLAHTRLSIIDLSPTGHQPMTTKDGQLTIVFNGEIYNYQALKDELISKGESFNSNSDTEVILKLYRQDGSKCLEKLRGMFAFFIWDKNKQRGFAARDPLGIKPFYFTQTDKSFAFASELRAVYKSDLASKNISSPGLYSYFTAGSFAEPYSILQDIQLLPAGHSLILKAGETHIEKYAAIRFNPQKIDNQQAIKITRQALQDSIAAHLVGDVSVGLFLSGGIDSTALLALASQVSDKPINTYSITFKEKEWNEGKQAKRIAEHFGSNHTEWLITHNLAQSMFNDFINAIDQPTIDGFNTYCVSKLAHENGEKVVLSGLGGDELFAGYKSFQLLPRMQYWSKKTRSLIDFYRFLENKFNHLLPSKIRRPLDFLTVPDSLNSAHQSLRGIFSRQEAITLLQDYSLSYTPIVENNSIAENQLDEISHLELRSYMRNQLLRDSDTMSMAHGLELRVPLIDYKLLQSIAKIPAEIRLRYGKKLLIESVPEIPTWVITQPKQGFRFPFDLWFKDQWHTSNTNKLAPKWIKPQPWYRAWNLLVLKQWLQKNL